MTKLELVRLGSGDDVTRLAKVLGCKKVKLSIKYLGLPLGANSKDVRMWDLIITRFGRRLAG